MKATIKVAQQFFYGNNKKTSRVNFIAREGSYHCNTIGALGISGNVARRAPYKPFLMTNVHQVYDAMRTGSVWEESPILHL